MYDINYIMNLLKWDKCKEEQERGRVLARNVYVLSCFMQPCDKKFNINVWENCAIIIAERSDEDLSGYISNLLQWLQDMNWPGSFIIFNRLKSFRKKKTLLYECNKAIVCAEALDDKVWADNLQSLKNHLEMLEDTKDDDV
ncbi:MAG: DUF5071 domain-containing protein [Lachnospiraceae bacterium]|nr:DUF5071 domain-containing protein [Lachnospiraceae bacterium]